MELITLIFVFGIIALIAPILLVVICRVLVGKENRQIIISVTQHNIRTIAELVKHIPTLSNEELAMDKIQIAISKGYLSEYTLDTENRRLVHKDDVPAQPNEPSKEGNICCPGCGAVCNTTNVCSYCGRLL